MAEYLISRVCPASEEQFSVEIVVRVKRIAETEMAINVAVEVIVERDYRPAQYKDKWLLDGHWKL